MRARLVLSVVCVVGLIGGCARGPEAVTSPFAQRLEHAGLAVEVMPSIDRFTYFGTFDGPNMLHVVGLDRGRPGDGSYTFFGGCYTWVSPQSGPLGWRGADGELMAWPPDPAMDVGPARRTARTSASVRMSGPVMRSGLTQHKTFTLVDNAVATLAYTLRNEGSAPVTAGTWINTAVDPRAVIAVRTAGVELVGWDAFAAERVRSIMSGPDAKGWSTIDVSAASWDGGAKVWFVPPPGAPVDIAVWRSGGRAGGYWLHRELPAMSAEEIARLREVGEAPMAVYIQPGGDGEWIVEAELYGPVGTIAPGESWGATERWRMVSARRPETGVLP